MALNYKIMTKAFVGTYSGINHLVFSPKIGHFGIIPERQPTGYVTGHGFLGLVTRLWVFSRLNKC